MKTLISNPRSLYGSYTKAAEIAAKCNEDSDGWKYEVQEHGNWYAIAVFDEDDYLLGEL